MMPGDTYSFMALAIGTAQRRSQHEDMPVYVYGTGDNVRPYGVTTYRPDDDQIIVTYDSGYLVNEPAEQETN